jgi:hypothetical protein
VISCVNINDKTVRAQDIRPRATLGTWSSSLVALFPPEEGGQVFEDEDI